MRRLLSILATLTVLVGTVGVASAATDYSGGLCTHPKSKSVSQTYYTNYCAVYGPNGTYTKQQQATQGNTSSTGSSAAYCYPSGSYWKAQVTAYPAYYSANNTYYQSHYGC